MTLLVSVLQLALLFRKFPFNNQCDKELDKQFTEQLDRVVKQDNLHRAISEHLAGSCNRSLEFCNLDLPIYAEPNRFHREDICRYLSFLAGPVGECFEYMRDEVDQIQLMECVWNTSDSKFKNEIKQYEFSDQDVYSCESIFHPCSTAIMEKDCAPGTLKIVKENEKILKTLKCAGIELWNRYYINFYYEYLPSLGIKV